MWKVKEAEAVYEQIENKLKGLQGKMVAIDPDSGDYFIGENTLDVYEKAKKKHPQSKFFFRRIGAKTAYVVGAKRV